MVNSGRFDRGDRCQWGRVKKQYLQGNKENWALGKMTLETMQVGVEQRVRCRLELKILLSVSLE